MLAYKDGQFVCRDCSHQERPDEALYRCSCPRCLKLAMGLSALAFVGDSHGANLAHG